MQLKKHVVKRAKRWVNFKLIMVLALAVIAGRIAFVKSAEGDTAFLSANDRSRWCTVASLVEHGTYVIDDVISIRDPKRPNRHPWDTIDKVRHRGEDGNMHSYSSKPPLFPTMVAGIYWLIHRCTGLKITDHPIWIPRIILVLVNVPLFGIFAWSMASVIDHLCRVSWAKYTALVATCFGTMLLPFSISLNNHLPAAAAVAVATALYFYAAEILDDDFGVWKSVNPMVYLLAGVAIALGVANELPALSMAVLFVGLFLLLEKASIVPVLVGASLVACLFFGTNWIAHQSLRPPYAHRGNGMKVASFAKTDVSTIASHEKEEELNGEIAVGKVEVGQIEIKQIELDLRERIRLGKFERIRVSESDEPGRWRVTASGRDYSLLDGGSRWELRLWDDWYEYLGSYWQDGRREGVDRGEPSRLRYFFHMTVGHHGILSLTPIFILIPFGIVRLVVFGPADLMRFSIAVTLASIVCLAFYVMRPLVDRNYGGVSASFRWMLWFVPLWLPMVAVTLDDWSQYRWFRVTAIVLIAISAASMSTALASPWQSPWLYNMLAG